jgi:NADH:ubiquinone oxidoreductase subunit 4 (subunit M)
MILGAAYTLRLIRAFLFGHAAKPYSFGVLMPAEAVAVLPLIVMLLVIGLHPVLVTGGL